MKRYEIFIADRLLILFTVLLLFISCCSSYATDTSSKDCCIEYCYNGVTSYLYYGTKYDSLLCVCIEDEIGYLSYFEGYIHGMVYFTLSDKCEVTDYDVQLHMGDTKNSDLEWKIKKALLVPQFFCPDGMDIPKRIQSKIKLDFYSPSSKMKDKLFGTDWLFEKDR